ncbi:MAG: Helix-turn-helix domain [Chloroflexia bacterium]|jgi:transcriptional regulator with XRE-family HTH domain|nr:Helix-turn-helix domain [Chloroflexia bacterium]
MFGVTTSLPKFGDLIREYRIRANLTQQELADRAGLSGPKISRWERGTVFKIDIQEVLRVAALLELPRDVLMSALRETDSAPALKEGGEAYDIPRDEMQVNLKTIGMLAPELPEEDREAVARIILMVKDDVERKRAAQRRLERQQQNASRTEPDATEQGAEENR